MICGTHLTPSVSTPKRAANVNTDDHNDRFDPIFRKGCFQRILKGVLEKGFLSEAPVFSTIEASIDLELAAK
jgi:hypothetical protein